MRPSGKKVRKPLIYTSSTKGTRHIYEQLYPLTILSINLSIKLRAKSRKPISSHCDVTIITGFFEAHDMKWYLTPYWKNFIQNMR